MSIFVSLIMLAIAVSIDSCGVGITYGLRKIRISLTSIFILAICSGTVMFVSMLVGDYIKAFVPLHYSNYIGASLLILIGLWSFYQYIKQTNQAEREDETIPNDTVQIHSLDPIWQMNLKRFGLVIQILKTPQTADVDRSGTISATEAIMLGIALSLDAFGAGIGAAFLHLPILLTVMTIMISSSLFIGAGLWLGKTLSRFSFIKFVGILPSIMLIIIGASKLF